MRILFASSELVPYSKTGGLADVASALPAALQRHGHEVTVFTPRYGQVDVASWDLRRKRFKLGVPVRGKTIQGGLLEGRSPEGFPVMFVDQPGLFERPGIYGQDGRDYEDNDERFAFFCHSVLESCKLLGLKPDVIHLNDWQTGPIAALLTSQYRDRPELTSAGTVFTIHNLGYQGLFAPDSVITLGLDWEMFTPTTLEFFGKVSYLKAGLSFADKLTTVSPRYAREIQTGQFGHGLEGLLKERSSDLKGILNGADYRTWNPETDEHLAASFTPDDLTGKTVCKTDLQKRLGLALDHDAALVGCTSRLASQKGIDLVIAAAEDLLGLGCQLAILGEGDAEMEQQLAGLAGAHPERFAYTRGYDEALAHQIQAGADLFLVPSRYEPCGLTQMYALRYGTIPVVRAVGGLDDTIEDVAEDGYGFKFSEATPDALTGALRRAVEQFADRVAWRRLMELGMSLDFAWDRPARMYESLYREVKALRA